MTHDLNDIRTSGGIEGHPEPGTATAKLAAQAERLAETMMEDDYRMRSGIPPDDPFEDWKPGDEDDPRGGQVDDNAKAEPATTPRGGCSIADVLNQWRAEGPLIHEPTGIATLDEVTGGGPVYGTRWYVIGAPDAGKTALLLQIGHVMAQRGVTVGILAVDEEPTDLVTRLVQRSGWLRRDCETRFTSTIDSIESYLADLPIRFYGDGTTIEDAASNLAAYAKARAEADPESHPHGPRALLLVDSLQTVPCAKEMLTLAAGGKELSMREAVTERARALRASASRYRLIALTTSEMNRAAYRTAEAAENANDMASAAESRAVEYSGRVLLALRSVAGEKDLVEVNIPKNKHRPANVDTSKLYLRIDRASQMLSETGYEPPAAPERDDKVKAKAQSDAAKVATLILQRPGINVRDLRSAARSTYGFGNDRTTDATGALGEAVQRVKGERTTVHMTLDVERVPQAIRTLMEVENV